MTGSVPVVEVYGGFWIRIWAAVIDWLLFALIVLPILWGAYGAEYFESEAILEGPLDFVLTWMLPALAVILFWIYKAATPGKMAVGLRIVDARTGNHPSTGQLIGRYFGYYVSLLPLGLGYFWILWDPKKQSFHDKLAGTVVLRRQRVPEHPSFPAPV
jgi:uncharacterized RDD family membrane protein YckC